MALFISLRTTNPANYFQELLSEVRAKSRAAVPAFGCGYVVFEGRAARACCRAGSLRAALGELEAEIEAEEDWSHVQFVHTGSSVPGFSPNPRKGHRNLPSNITNPSKSDVGVCIAASVSTTPSPRLSRTENSSRGGASRRRGNLTAGCARAQAGQPRHVPTVHRALPQSVVRHAPWGTAAHVRRGRPGHPTTRDVYSGRQAQLTSPPRLPRFFEPMNTKFNWASPNFVLMGVNFGLMEGH